MLKRALDWFESKLWPRIETILERLWAEWEAKEAAALDAMAEEVVARGIAKAKAFIEKKLK